MSYIRLADLAQVSDRRAAQADVLRKLLGVAKDPVQVKLLQSKIAALEGPGGDLGQWTSASDVPTAQDFIAAGVDPATAAQLAQNAATTSTGPTTLSASTVANIQAAKTAQPTSSGFSVKDFTAILGAALPAAAQIGGAYLQSDAQRKALAAQAKANKQPQGPDLMSLMAMMGGQRAPQQDTGSSMSPGLIAGLAIGGIALVGAVVVIATRRNDD